MQPMPSRSKIHLFLRLLSQEDFLSRCEAVFVFSNRTFQDYHVPCVCSSSELQKYVLGNPFWSPAVIFWDFELHCTWGNRGSDEGVCDLPSMLR